MPRPWIAEREITTELAADLIGEQFPALAPVRLEPLGVGFDNTAFLANDCWVFRFPRREIAVGLLEIETRALPSIADRLPLAVPRAQWRGIASARFAWPFAGYRALPGRTACGVLQDDVQRVAAATMLARFLRALHDIPADEARRLGVPTDRIRRLDIAYRSPRLVENLNQLASLKLIGDSRPWIRLVAETPLGWRPRDDTLVHGDLYARHLLLDESARPCGVIDWGDMHLGDPAVDLSIAHSFLPPAAHAAFRAAYGAIDDDAWLIARFKALFTAVMIVLYGHDVSDDGLVSAGLTTLRYAVAARQKC